MPDREKVIKGLSELKKYLPSTMWESINDALSLLKEQDAIAPIPPANELDLWKCGNCNHQLFRCTHQKYCEMCGRRVKWEIDIRKDVPGLWCDDITFCSERCAWKDCPRNEKNIRDKTVPHSFFVETPPDCPKQSEEGGSHA